MEANEGAQDGNGDGNESNIIVEMGGGNGDGNEDGIREGGGEAKKRKKPHKTCVGNGGDLGAKKKKRKKERVGPVAANPDHLLYRE